MSSDDSCENLLIKRNVIYPDNITQDEIPNIGVRKNSTINEFEFQNLNEKNTENLDEKKKMTEDEVAWLTERIRSDSFLREYNTPARIANKKSLHCSAFNNMSMELNSPVLLFGEDSFNN